MSMRFLSGLGLLSALAAAGCGSNALPQQDLDKGQAAVETGLAAWKKGESPHVLRAQNIEMSDPDWNAGYRLLDFKMVNTTGEVGGNVRCAVVLTFAGSGGTKVNREVVYEASVKDKVVVGRDPLS